MKQVRPTKAARHRWAAFVWCGGGSIALVEIYFFSTITPFAGMITCCTVAPVSRSV